MIDRIIYTIVASIYSLGMSNGYTCATVIGLGLWSSKGVYA